LYVHKIRLDIRKDGNVEVYATKDCTGSKIAPTNISGLAGADDHVVNEYTVNSKAWSIKANYNGASYLHSVQLTVDSEPMPLQFTGVELPAETLSLTEGQEYAAPAKVLETGVEGVAVSYESSDPTTVAVDANGVLTALKGTGSATITATGVKEGVTKTDTMEVSIAGFPLPVAEPAVGTKYLFGLDQKGLGKFLYSTGKVDGNYAAVTELNTEGAKFELVAVEGGYNIKATLADGSTKYMNYETSESGEKSYANIKFNDEAKIVWKLDLAKQCVYAPVTFAVNTKNSGDYYVGAYNTNRTFSMSKTSYLKPDSTNYAAWFTELGVRPEVTSVTVDPTEVTLALEETTTLKATVLPALADQTITWASDAEAVATVDATGKVTGVSAGTANITATTANGLVAKCVVTVTATVQEEITKTFVNTHDVWGTTSSTAAATYTVDGVTIATNGVKTGSSNSADKNYGYFMVKQGYLASTSALEGYYVSKVVLTYTSGTGAKGRTITTLTASSMNSLSATAGTNTPVQGGSYTVTNTDQTLLYWNVSNTVNENCQFASIAVTYSLIK
ncbi:MAG: Ig-like domain-containing protein, partial [Clostridia bacterium]|nr:Ig-like domain-containing protein [Clostridia bacterium]